MPPSDASTPRASYGMNTSLSASVAIGLERFEVALRDQVLAGLPAVPSACATISIACASACATRSRASACPSAARIAACFEPSALTICDCFWPSARRIADDFSPSAVVTTARRVRSAVICFSIVRRISSGGVMFFSSMRITLMPHCWVAVSSAVAQLPVDGVARRERVIEVERADDVAERRQRQLLDAPAQVLDLVDGAHRIHDDVVDDRIHLHRHVVARDDGLRFDLGDLLALVDGFADRVEERKDRVEAGLGGAMVLAEPLDDLHLLLRHDLHRLHQDDEQEQRDGEEDVVSCRADLQNDAVGADDPDARAGGNRRGGAGGPVLAVDVDAAGAERGLDIVRDDAFVADERLGARRHAGAPMFAPSGAAAARRTTAPRTMMNSRSAREVPNASGGHGGGECAEARRR